MLRQVDSPQGHRSRLAHILEHDHCADHLPSRIVDRRGGVFDGRLDPVAPDEEAVRGQPDDSVELDGLVHRVPRGFARRGVDDVEHLGERPAQRLPRRPARHAFGHRIEIGHVARNIRAEHGVADGVKRGPRALLFEEQCLFRRVSLDETCQENAHHFRAHWSPWISRGVVRDQLIGRGPLSNRAHPAMASSQARNEGAVALALGRREGQTPGLGLCMDSVPRIQANRLTKRADRLRLKPLPAIPSPDCSKPQI